MENNNHKRTTTRNKMFTRSATAQKEYKKDEMLKKEDVDEIVEWSRTETRLPTLTGLDAMIFLHSCYYDLDATKRTIITHFLDKFTHQDIFGLRDPEHPLIAQAMEVSLVSVLPKLTPEGYAILLMKVMDTDPNKYNFGRNMNLYDMVTMLYLHLNGSCKGMVLILDNDGCRLGHIAKINLFVMKRFIHYLQDGMPIRLKRIHLLNVPYFTEKFLPVVKSLIKSELAEMMIVHTDYKNTLFNEIPQEILPEEYGGKEGTFKSIHENTKNWLRTHADYFRHEEKQISELEPPEQPKSNWRSFFRRQ